MSSFKNNIRTGIIFTGVSKYTRVFITLLVGIILARLLTPEDFGIVAIVTVFTGFFQSLSNSGINLAVIQNKDLNKKDIESIFTFTIILGLILSVLFFLASTPIANFYDRGELKNISRLLSISIFFFTIQSIPKAICEKKMFFKKLSLITITSQLFTGLLAVFLAYKGYKYYSLIYKTIADAVITFFIFYFFFPVKLTASGIWFSMKKIANFSIFQYLFNLFNYFSRNSDNFLIGKFLGATSLGFYDIAYRLMMLPIQNLTQVITPVLLPVYSDKNVKKETIYSTYTMLVKVLAIIGFPISVFLFFCAEEIILGLYGKQWVESIKIFRILSLSVGFQIVLSSVGSIFQVFNKTNLLFYSGLLSSLFMVLGILLGVLYFKELYFVSFGILIAITINFFQAFLLLIKCCFKKDFFQFIKNFIYPLAVSLILCVIYLIVETVNLTSLYSIVVKSFIFVSVLGLAVFYSNDYKSIMLRIIKK